MRGDSWSTPLSWTGIYIKRYSRIIQVVGGTPGLLLLVGLVYVSRGIVE